MFKKLKNLAAIARAARAAQADREPAVRGAVTKWAGDDYPRARREAGRNKAARAAAKARRAARVAAHLWDYIQ